MTGTDLLAELQSSLGAAYAFDRELGGGGMARVFLAHERELGRPVVIKLLNPELAEGINADRFEREIKLAASLQQANIVPLLSAGRAARYAYDSMPFVEGLSLRDRLARDSVVPIGEGVSLLTQKTSGRRSWKNTVRPRTRSARARDSAGCSSALGWLNTRWLTSASRSTRTIGNPPRRPSIYVATLRIPP